MGEGETPQLLVLETNAHQQTLDCNGITSRGSVINFGIAPAGGTLCRWQQDCPLRWFQCFDEQSSGASTHAMRDVGSPTGLVSMPR